jgi:hypothetical protein
MKLEDKTIYKADWKKIAEKKVRFRPWFREKMQTFGQYFRYEIYWQNRAPHHRFRVTYDGTSHCMTINDIELSIFGTEYFTKATEDYEFAKALLEGLEEKI